MGKGNDNKWVWKMVDTETYKVRIEGTRPLLMHNPSSITDKPTMRRGEMV